METVERLCDRVALINRGEKVLDGSVAEVKARHGKNTVVLAYDGDGSFLGTLPGVAKVSDFGQYVEVRLARGHGPAAAAARGGGAAPAAPVRDRGAEPARHLRRDRDGPREGGRVSAKLWAVVKREYIERVRTKGFVIGTILGPLLMGGMMVVPVLGRRARAASPCGWPCSTAPARSGAPVEEALRAARFDGQGALRRAARAPRAPRARAEASLKKAVLDGSARRLPRAARRTRWPPARRATTASNVSNRIDLRTMERAVSDVLVGLRLTGAGLDPAKVKDLTRELDLKTIRLSETGEREDRGAAMIFSVILLMILYMSILMWGQAVMTSVIEEKTSRVVEVMALGRLAHDAARREAPRRRRGGPHAVPRLGALALRRLPRDGGAPRGVPARCPRSPRSCSSRSSSSSCWASSFYAALYAAIGAAVNTVQEAQNLVFPVMLPIILGMVFFPAVLEAPDGPLAVTLSMIPGISPAHHVPADRGAHPAAVADRAVDRLHGRWASSAVLWVAARVYRVGILMYGKKPTFPELMKWVRHS